MEKYNIVIIDDQYTSRAISYNNFLTKEVENVDIEFEILPGESVLDVKTILRDKYDKIDAFFIDVKLEEYSWNGYEKDGLRGFSIIMKWIEDTYKNTVIPPCFIISKDWEDPKLLIRISKNFSAIDSHINPSGYYRFQDLEAIYESANMVDSNGDITPIGLQEERSFIKTEIEKVRKEKFNTLSPVDAVIIFAVPDERDAAYKIFELDVGNDKYLNRYGLVYQDVMIDGKHIVFVIQNEMGMTEASRVTTSSLLAFKPRIVIMVGICAGDKNELKLGDIIIARETFDYAIGKLKKQELSDGSIKEYITHRSYRVQTDSKLSRFLSQMSSKQNTKGLMRVISDKFYDDDNPDNINSIYVSPLASGPWVVDTESIFTEIEGVINDKCFALDMEAYAVSQAATTLGVPSLIIKSVQDYANGNKRADEAKARKFASFASAYFVKLTLNDIISCLNPEEIKVVE